MSAKRIDVLAVMADDAQDAFHERDRGGGSSKYAMDCDRLSIEARDVVKAQYDALKLAEQTMTAWLEWLGYEPGSNTAHWAREVRETIAALVPIRSALARMGDEQ